MLATSPWSTMAETIAASEQERACASRNRDELLSPSRSSTSDMFAVCAEDGCREHHAPSMTTNDPYPIHVENSYAMPMLLYADGDCMDKAVNDHRGRPPWSFKRLAEQLDGVIMALLQRSTAPSSLYRESTLPDQQAPHRVRGSAGRAPTTWPRPRELCPCQAACGPTIPSTRRARDSRHEKELSLQQMGGSPYQWTTCSNGSDQPAVTDLTRVPIEMSEYRQKQMIPTTSRIADDGSGTAFTAARGPCS